MDLNFKELQYIASELTHKECRKLAEALHSTDLFMLHNRNFTGSHEPKKTCMFLLLKYDRKEGKGESFIELDIRLREIGRNDLAEKLSKLVYHEKALALKENFLDDPFKKLTKKNSFLLEDEKSKTVLVKEETSNSNETLWICMAILSMLILACVGLRFFCPDFATSLWQRIGSKVAVDLCDSCDAEFSRCWKKFKINYQRHVIGLDVEEFKEDEEALMKEAGLKESDLNEINRDLIRKYSHLYVPTTGIQT